ncbi:serine/threonine-protein phosphatase 4 regulatory subunit protein [Trifolium repens]|nr:serine/threonine-protein phosphatase 4 regulatory subunit protein [Trifolium repens]
METQPQDSLQNAPVVVSSSDGADNLQNDAAVADVSNHRDTEVVVEEEEKSDVSKDEVIRIIQDIASTGRFRHDWDNLKSMLSFQLKQVLSEYPEAKATDEQQRASLGESYSDLVNKLNEALTCFIDGPPFTLQRVCEILLDAKNIYPNLSKLALALEKNLLVTSTLTIYADPIPQDPVQEPDDQEKASEKQQQQQSDVAQNGSEPEPLVADNDEVMVEADTNEDVAVEMETFEDAKSSEIDSEPNANNAQAS